MLHLALSRAERKAYLAALRNSGAVRVRVDILDSDEKHVGSLNVPREAVLDGSVVMDARADVTRSLDLTVVDGKRHLHFDKRSPRRGAMFADNFVAVRYGVYLDDFDEWVDVPIFRGPVTGFERTGDEVRIEAQGKESLGLDPHLATHGYTLHKGWHVDDAIRNVMNRLGEKHYNLPDMKKRLPRARAVQAADEPWRVVKFGFDSRRSVERGKGKKKHRERIDVHYGGLIALPEHEYRLFYDGRGRLTAKQRSARPVYVFDGDVIEGDVTVTYDQQNARNHVIVVGARVVKGKKPHRHHVQMRAEKSLPRHHPLSPHSLARNGKPRYMTAIVEAPTLKTKKACEKRAEAVLRHRSKEGLSVAFQCLPIPHLEELDTVRVSTDEEHVTFPLERFTLPLTADGVMEVGWGRGNL